MSCIQIDIKNTSGEAVIWQFGKPFPTVALVVPEVYSAPAQVLTIINANTYSQEVPEAATYAGFYLWVAQYDQKPLPTVTVRTFDHLKPVFNTYAPDYEVDILESFNDIQLVPGLNRIPLNYTFSAAHTVAFLVSGIVKIGIWNTTPGWKWRFASATGYGNLNISTSVFAPIAGSEGGETTSELALKTNYDYGYFCKSVQNVPFALARIGVLGTGEDIAKLVSNSFDYVAVDVFGGKLHQSFHLRQKSNEKGFAIEHIFLGALFIDGHNTLNITVPANFEGTFSFCEPELIVEPEIEPVPEIEPLPEIEPEPIRRVSCCWPWLVVAVLGVVGFVLSKKHKNE